MKTPKRQISFLEKKEVEKIINTIPTKGLRNLRDRALIEVLFSTGLRISEALALSEEPFIQNANKTLELSITGKGGWQRTIYFSPRSLAAVGAYLAVRKDTGTELFPVGVRATQLMIKRRARAAGIEKRVSPHTMRHSFAVHLLQKGASVFYVQQFLGHRNLATTSIYLHSTNAELKELHKKYMK